jgi:adenine-specific DNA-methyltransferase
MLSRLTQVDDIRAAQRVSYRLLEESPALSAGDPATRNMLVQNDNLDALNALLRLHAERLNFSFIGSRSTTRSAFEPYDQDRAAGWDSRKIAVIEYSNPPMIDRLLV